MAGLGAKLPLAKDDDDGIALIKDARGLAKQNFLNLLLTNPGERIMIGDFGVGLKKYFFDPDSLDLRSEISSKINSQVNRYLPFISIISIEFNTSEYSINFLGIKIKYNIVPLGYDDSLEIYQQSNNISSL